MAFYNNGFHTFGGDMARFLQASASNGHQPNGTGQFGGNPNRNGHAPRHPGNNNNNHNNQRRAQQLRTAFTRTRDGDVVMRDAFVAPITAPAEEDRDVVMTDAHPLPEEATAMLNLAVNEEAQGSTTTGLQVVGAPFYF
ncbi:uncharacterized protein NFIA_091880 [Aspergillus fischeri NRRL 181]|uniref:Uncharacterized protein n=1 Tax=Neosartorya fischeri (strain ATCC 1020 / DSM 3700 / CBS 544.65 / FGSC A1164 / JCM 1740 / NRRL 181 / WB 181) TaxID=331117 RepID=A1DIM1_NEOFI|nr:conserved hypothetical protein [Aspergillus fischeri NRRL 181]EAW19228.1 conserved hypothetical protein [Aspergillus fischeri NRRL 181]